MPKKITKASKKSSKPTVLSEQKTSLHRLAVLFVVVAVFVFFLLLYFYWQMEQIGIRLQQVESSRTTSLRR